MSESLAQQVVDLTKERDALRAFAQHVLDDFPDSCETSDAADELARAATMHGLFTAKTLTITCAEDCDCARYWGTDSPGEFVCYRPTKLLEPK